MTDDNTCTVRIAAFIILDQLEDDLFSMKKAKAHLVLIPVELKERERSQILETNANWSLQMVPKSCVDRNIGGCTMRRRH